MPATFSELLNMFELRGQCWCVAEMDRVSGFSLPQTDDLFFYAVFDGTIRIAGSAEAVIEVDAGEVAIVLASEAHSVRTRPRAPAAILEYLRSEGYEDEPVSIRIGEGGRTGARLLAGRLKANWPDAQLRRSLPSVLKVPAHDLLVDVPTMARNLTGHGSSALLTRIASLLLTGALRRDPECEHLFLASATTDPITRGVQLIRRHPHRPWSVSMLARAVGMGRSNFAARFLEQVGKTPMQVLTERRMALATELLVGGRLKVSEISARVGYVSEAAFSRRYARHFGVPPGRARAARGEGA